MTEKTLWRIPKLPREEWTEDAIEAFSFWGEPNAREEGSKTNIMMVMANHPTMCHAWNVWGKHMLVTNTTPLRDRELVILRLGWRLRSEYEWHNHVGYALKLGMSLEEIAAVKQGPDAPNWNEHDRSVLAAVDELLDTNDLSDASWAALSAFYDRRQIMDFVLMVGHYAMTAWAINAFRMPLEAHADKIGWDLKTASGRAPGATEKPGESEDWAEKRGYSQ
ncbi:MAG: carboxymuconolactone decarboxylase family protein [Sphingomonadales bacterium]|nr:carboxymuconolactone decarboxylase family protein [Sphingomonadales bacterium]